MRVGMWLAGLAVSLVGMAAACAAPLEAYGRLPTGDLPEISPDGTKIAAVITNDEGSTIIVTRLADNKLLSAAQAGRIKVRYLRWAGPENVLIITSETQRIIGLTNPRDEYLMVQNLDLTTNRARPMMTDVKDKETMNVIRGEPDVRIIDGQPAVLVRGVAFNGDRGYSSVFRLGVKTNSTKVIAQGGPLTRRWIIGQDGDVLAQSTYDDKTKRWALKAHGADGWREVVVVDTSGDEDAGLVGLGRTPDTLLIWTSTKGVPRYEEVQVAGGARKVLEVNGEGDAIYDPASHTLIGVRTLVGDEEQSQFFEPKDQSLWRSLAKAYPGDRVSLVSWNADRSRIVLLVDSPTHGAAYALVDRAAKSASWLGDQYESVKSADISPVRAISFKAADGLALTGYLTTPRGREAKNLPLVVFPHGGPASRDTPGFDWWAQAMASRGYAVLQVNFRGSEGFGQAHLKAGFGQWGRKMQTDLSDGVRHLAKEGAIDPKRVCIVGASYGGYAALAGATLDPDVYRCAAAISGISDVRRFIQWAGRQNGREAQDYWVEFMGGDDVRDPHLLEISPIEHIDRVKAPVLLIHGMDDTVVPLEQSRVMADALTRAGKPVELVVQKGEDHWLSRGETRLAMLQSVVAFLEKNNPPD